MAAEKKVKDMLAADRDAITRQVKVDIAASDRLQNHLLDSLNNFNASPKARPVQEKSAKGFFTRLIEVTAKQGLIGAIKFILNNGRTEESANDKSTKIIEGPVSKRMDSFTKTTEKLIRQNNKPVVEAAKELQMKQQA